MRALVVLAAMCASLACRVAPHPADPRAPRSSVARELVAAPAVRVELLRVNGASIPDRAWERALATLARQLSGPIEVRDAGAITLPAGADGRLAAPFEWPIAADGRAVVERAIEGTDAWLELLRGDEPVALVSVGPDGSHHATPIVPRDALFVVVLPRDAGRSGLHGWCKRTMRFDAATKRYLEGGALIVIQANSIRAHAWWPVSATRLFEHTLVHELGHALGLPADPARTWNGPHGGPHCTHPRCALYPAFDWRSLVSGVVDGWPLDWCAPCRAELARARGGDAR